MWIDLKVIRVVELLGFVIVCGEGRKDVWMMFMFFGDVSVVYLYDKW